MFQRKTAGMLTVVGLSAAILTGIASNAVADTQAPAAKIQPAQKAPSNQSIADSMAADMAKKLGLSKSTEKKVSELFKNDGKAIRAMQMQLSEKRRELNNLSPTDKHYMAKVDKLASESGKITEKLTIKYAKSRAELYALLTPKQIEKMENFGKHAPKATHG